MERVRKYIDHMGLYAAALLKWIVVGGLVGGVGGVVGALFHLGVNYATEVRLAHPWVLYLLPVGGLVIAGLYKLCRLEGKGTNAIIESVHFGSDVPLLLVPLIFVSTVITHLCGGSAGREGAALQIGGGIGYRTGKLLQLGEKDLPLATLCGMSGVFSALFGTPLTATVFALEVISVGVLYYAGLIPCITAAMTGYLVSLLMGVPPTRFTVAMPPLDAWTMLLVVVLAILCALVSILFCRGLHITEHLAARLVKNPYLRGVVGGAVIVGLTLLLGTTDYNGAGMDVITRALSGQTDGWAWLLKLLFTAVTIGCGFKGGEVVPSFFVGAAFGCFMGGLLGLPAGVAASAPRLHRRHRPCSRVLRRGELPHRLGDPERGAVRRGGDAVLCHGLRHQLCAVGLLRAVQQPDHPLLQAAGGVHQRPYERITSIHPKGGHKL